MNIITNIGIITRYFSKLGSSLTKEVQKVRISDKYFLVCRKSNTSTSFMVYDLSDRTSLLSVQFDYIYGLAIGIVDRMTTICSSYVGFYVGQETTYGVESCVINYSDCSEEEYFQYSTVYNLEPKENIDNVLDVCLNICTKTSKNAVVISQHCDDVTLNELIQHLKTDLETHE